MATSRYIEIFDSMYLSEPFTKNTVPVQVHRFRELGAPTQFSISLPLWYQGGFGAWRIGWMKIAATENRLKPELQTGELAKLGVSSTAFSRSAEFGKAVESMLLHVA